MCGRLNNSFDPVKAMFLPDRYIQGGCPKCGAPEQYGDACEVCGAVYNATELINPRSTLTGATPVLAKSDHYFFRLSDPRCVAYLRAWLSGGSTRTGRRFRLKSQIRSGSGWAKKQTPNWPTGISRVTPRTLESRFPTPQTNIFTSGLMHRSDT